MEFGRIPVTIESNIQYTPATKEAARRYGTDKYGGGGEEREPAVKLKSERGEVEHV